MAFFKRNWVFARIAFVSTFEGFLRRGVIGEASVVDTIC
jgi:hypothetical protein